MSTVAFPTFSVDTLPATAYGSRFCRSAASSASFCEGLNEKRLSSLVAVAEPRVLAVLLDEEREVIARDPGLDLVVVVQVEAREALEHPGHLGVLHDLLEVLRLLVDGVPDLLFTLFDGNLVQLLQREPFLRGLPQHVAEEVFLALARRLGERV